MTSGVDFLMVSMACYGYRFAHGRARSEMSSNMAAILQLASRLRDVKPWFIAFF